MAAISNAVSEGRLAAIIGDFARRLTAGVPATRGLPYLGLESASGSGTHLLDELSARGIFRKYELVLDVGDDLGATGRWLAARLGCTAVVTAAGAEGIAAGRALTRRSRLSSQVRHVQTEAVALPFKYASFTHAWIVETLPRLQDARTALAELRRVVRPGGYLAVQDLVHRPDAAAPELPGWRFTTGVARQESLRSAGFVDVVARDVDDASERSAMVAAARTELHAQLAAGTEPALASAVAERGALAAMLADGRLHVVQLFARRP